MDNFFDRITNIGKFYGKKVGYNIDEMPEFKTVRDSIIRYGMNPNNFDKNLKDLYINTSTETSIGVNGNYNARTNSMHKPVKSNDFVHELFHMASNNKDTNNERMGVLQKNNVGMTTGQGFNEGITDYFTHLTCPDYEPNYPFEEKIISVISEVYGLKPFNNYFNCDPDNFYKSFGSDLPFIMEISKQCDIYNKGLNEYIGLLQKGDIQLMLKDVDKVCNKMFNGIVSACTKLFELLELKGIDSSKYLDEFKELFNSNNNNIVSLRGMVENTSYETIDGVFEAIIGSDNFTIRL